MAHLPPSGIQHAGKVRLRRAVVNGDTPFHRLGGLYSTPALIGRLPAVQAELFLLHSLRLGGGAQDNGFRFAARIILLERAGQGDGDRNDLGASGEMLGQRQIQRVKKPDAAGGFQGGRGDDFARVTFEGVPGRAGVNGRVGEVERGVSAQDETNGRRLLTVGGGEAELIILAALGRRIQLEAERFGGARERFPVGVHEALGRQREAEQPVERQAGGLRAVADAPPAFVAPGLVKGAPEEHRVRREGQRAVLDRFAEAFGLRLLQIGKRRVGLGAPLQADLLGEKRQPQVERVRGGRHAGFVALKPGLPMGDFFLALPLLEGGLQLW